MTLLVLAYLMAIMLVLYWGQWLLLAVFWGAGSVGLLVLLAVVHLSDRRSLGDSGD